MVLGMVVNDEDQEIGGNGLSGCSFVLASLGHLSEDTEHLFASC